MKMIYLGHFFVDFFSSSILRTNNLKEKNNIYKVTIRVEPIIDQTMFLFFIISGYDFNGIKMLISTILYWVEHCLY